MEVANTRRQTAYPATTRIYSPTRGSSAYAYAQQAVAAPLPQRKPQPPQQPAPRPKAQPRQELSAGCRWALLCTVLLLAAAALTVVFRYADIARQYAQINQVKSDIESARLRLKELNVALECAVSIQQAQEAAARMGMTYPTASQYVRAGDALALPNAGATNIPDGGGVQPGGA